MRLWHKDLLPLLPKQWLQGQHRECTAMRGLGWGMKHETVNYVYQYEYTRLYWYHLLVIDELEKHGVNIDQRWKEQTYRGKNVGYDASTFTTGSEYADYPEHNKSYMHECLVNLAGKGIEINVCV